MSNLFNAAEVNGKIGAESLILNDYKLKINDIDGGHRLTVERGADVQTMDVMDGEGCTETDVTRILEETGLMKLTKSGAVWTQSNATGADGAIFEYITYADGVWLACCTGDSDTRGLWYSTDGMTWEQTDIVGNVVRAITYGNGLWVAAIDSILGYSSDGMTWEQSNVTGREFSAITYANGIWVAGGIGCMVYSTDGKTWEECNSTSAQSSQTRSGSATNIFNVITYANGIWIASSAMESSGIGIWCSSDGMTWEESNVTSGQFLAMDKNGTITHANGIWVAGECSDGSGIYYSSDGMEWTQSNITDVPIATISYANGIWVAACYGVYYSTDGMTWEKSNIVDNGSMQLPFLTYGNGIWVVSGVTETQLQLRSSIPMYPLVCYSTDGMTWTKIDSLTSPLISIVYANGIWVGGSIEAGLWYSTPILDNLALKSEVKPQVYSYDEQRIGTWINGKPIYRKTLMCDNNGNSGQRGAAPTPSNGYIVFGDNGEIEDLNIEQYTNVHGVCKTYETDVSLGRVAANYVWQTIPRVVPKEMAEYAIGLGDLTPTGITVIFGSAYSYAETYLTIEYTKTTD